MNRIPLIDRAHTSPDRKALLDQIHGAFGATPNMFRAVANSPAALQSMWAAFGALGSGTLSAKLGEQIAVAVANRNACEYCLAAHTALGRKAGATADEMAAAQVGPVVGYWYGTLKTPGKPLPIVFHIKADGATTVDSPAQHAMGSSDGDIELF